jgi:hypothetical protein
MATRNGADVIESKVEVRPDIYGSYTVVSVVTTIEYTGCSEEFAQFLAKQLRDEGITYPKVNE